jgi:hypothetical protein
MSSMFDDKNDEKEKARKERKASVVLSYLENVGGVCVNLSCKGNRIDRQTFKQFEQLTNF